LRPTRVLRPLNGQLQIAGETFYNHELGLDLEDRVLFIWHPLLGELAITERDGIELRFLNEEIPSWVRTQMHGQGWLTMSVQQLLDYFADNHSAREGGLLP